MTMTLIETQLWPEGAAPSSQYCAEEDRLKVMATYGLDDLGGDQELADIAGFAAKLCNAPICLVSIVESERQHFLTHIGLQEMETPRSVSFCARAMLRDDIMIVPNALEDPEFADNPLVTGPPHIRFYAGVPLISEEGAPLGTLCVIDTKPRPEGLNDLQMEGLRTLGQAVKRRLFVHRQKNAFQDALTRSEAQFKLLADSIPDISWSSDRHGNFDYFNRRWYDYVGEGERPEGGWESFFHPEDRAGWFDAWEEAREKGEPYETEYRLRRADGSYRWMLARGLPVRGPNGQIERWFGTITDIDDTHRHSEERELLASELAHRIKNIFSVISGLITLRARGDEKLEAFGEELGATIRSLGRAQDFVRPLKSEKGDELVSLLDILMAPYQDGKGTRVQITGDRVKVGAKAATPLALVFHELATNAAKYGALSIPDGTLSITIAKNGHNVSIGWRENNGPPAKEPTSNGFGSRLIEMATRNQLGGAIERQWNEDGFAVDISLPLDRIGT